MRRLGHLHRSTKVNVSTPITSRATKRCGQLILLETLSENSHHLFPTLGSEKLLRVSEGLTSRVDAAFSLNRAKHEIALSATDAGVLARILQVVQAGFLPVLHHVDAGFKKVETKQRYLRNVSQLESYRHCRLSRRHGCI